MESNHNVSAGESELPQPLAAENNIPQPNARFGEGSQQIIPTPTSMSHQAPSDNNDSGNQLIPTTSPSTQQLIADDADLIEKEWVTKAKAIVGQTKDDPYLQNQSINKVKADYVKKRYNKQLKISEG